MRLFKLFDYNEFIEELKENDDKKEIVEKYSKYYGPQEKVSIYETAFYKDYLSKFDIPFQLVVPEDIEEEFDWDLLTRLVVGSFSSNYDLLLDENSQQSPPKVHLYIAVSRDETHVTKELSELWSFQVLRLFEIYIEEQMNLFSLKKENDEIDEDSILEEQKMIIRKFKRKIAPIINQSSINKEIENLI
jgi:hypothetical protein